MSNTPLPRRTQAERSRASREKIIQAAIAFFAQHGFRGAKLRDIAEAAALTEPGLLHHFPSKTSLLMAVLAERDRVDGERFNPTQLGEKNDLLDSFHKLVEYNETVPGLVQLFTTLAVESIQAQHPGHDFFAQRYRNLRENTVEVLREGQARGEIRSDLPAEDLVIMIFAIMDGLQIQWLLEPDAIDMAHIFGGFVQLLRAK
jgi:AcrR family transcriptional regulator